ncbi:MAG: LysM peptidoglycan-binding domain-containing protein, partial [Desulfocucumaceae bacterium]
MTTFVISRRRVIPFILLFVLCLCSFAGQALAATHTVTSGESLWTIGMRYGVTVSALRSANNISGNTIFSGQKLYLPERTQTYSVRPGDSLYTIAVRHGLTVNKLMSLNGLKDTVIYPGQKLKIGQYSQPKTEVSRGGGRDTAYSSASEFDALARI